MWEKVWLKNWKSWEAIRVETIRMSCVLLFARDRGILLNLSFSHNGTWIVVNWPTYPRSKWRRARWEFCRKLILKNGIDGLVKFKSCITAEFLTSTYIDNIQDWCISRQLWWGHRIPAYQIKLNEHHDQGNWETKGDRKWLIISISLCRSLGNRKWHRGCPIECQEALGRQRLFQEYTFWAQEGESVQICVLSY